MRNQWPKENETHREAECRFRPNANEVFSHSVSELHRQDVGLLIDSIGTNCSVNQ